MNKINLSILIIVLCSLSCNLLTAQVSSGAVKKAEKIVTEKAIEKTLNGLVNKLFGSDTTSTSGATKSDVDATSDTATSTKSSSGGLFGSKVVDKKFTFDITLEMEITTVDKKGKSNVINSIGHYPQNGSYVGAETESIINIMDFDEMKNYAIIGGKVTILGLKNIIAKANRMAEKEAEKAKKKGEEPEQLIPEKTGKTAIIAGFKCDEYHAENEDLDCYYYMTKEIGISPDAMMNTFATNPNVTVPKDLNMLMLKMTVLNKDDNSKTTVLTTNVSKEKKTYDISKYKATDLSKLF